MFRLNFVDSFLMLVLILQIYEVNAVDFLFLSYIIQNVFRNGIVVTIETSKLKFYCKYKSIFEIIEK